MTVVDRLRTAQVSDYAQLSSLYRRAALANSQDRAVLQAHPEALELPLDPIEAGQVLVLERNAEIAGFISVRPIGAGKQEVTALFVEPKSWNQGVGRKLIKAATNRATQTGDAVLFLTGNPQARGFYRACGFDEIGTKQTAFGTALQMQMNIDPQNLQIQEGTARLS